MKLVVGLGNPGSQYAKTRHNIGRRLVEALAETRHANWQTNKALRSQWIQLDQEGSPFLVALPESFMNESGETIRLLAEHFRIDFNSELLVVVDDVSLPFGRLRLRASGQDGGHLGLRSIEEVMRSQTYARLRIGIAPSESLAESLESYVLRPFKAEEERRLPEIFERAVQSCILWITGPIEKAMDYTNKPLPD